MNMAESFLFLTYGILGYVMGIAVTLWANKEERDSYCDTNVTKLPFRFRINGVDYLKSDK